MISIIGGGPAGTYAGSLLAKHKDVTIYEDHNVIGKPIQCTGIITGNLDEVIKVPKELVLNKLKRVKVYSQNEETEFKLRKYNYVFEFIDTDVLIGADGPLSNVAKSAGLFNNRKFVVGLQIRAKIECEEDVFETFLSEGDGYFGWLVPEDNKTARIGIAASSNPRKHFQEILKLRGGEFIEDQSGPIPMYQPEVKAQNGNVFLIGDAATMVKATTYGGILPGMVAGHDLDKAIKERLDYDRLWKSGIGKELMYHLRIRKILDKFKDSDYDELLKMVRKEKVKETIEIYDREYPSKMIFKLLYNEPRFLKFLFKFVPESFINSEFLQITMVTAQDLGYQKGQAEVFEGTYVKVMPRLREAGLRPLNSADIMDKRLESDNSPFWNYYFDTVTGLAATRTKVRVFPRCELLLALNPDTRLEARGIVLPSGYDGDAVEFNREELILNEELTEKQVLAHKGWLALANNDQNRLAKYAEKVFRLGKDRFGYNEMMGLYVPNDENPIVRGVIL
ncbi:NAD(P)/FAD-dependent oxidoreductase, partial [Candidatus Woesearchaeota archaeon]|nr:NAD(P)/FAD-dependent oxidoreductase [Candidatus Woesearchaeota archaeon]